MPINKTIIQRAQGYGNQPVTATVQIDGTTILQGPVPTLDQMPPTLPDSWSADLGVDAWTWTVNPSFGGGQTMTLTVDNGQLYLCDTFYSLTNDPGNVYPLTYPQQQGDIQFFDPFTSVSINGIPTVPNRDPGHDGQWVWQLTAGDQFTCTVNITAQPIAPTYSKSGIESNRQLSTLLRQGFLWLTNYSYNIKITA